MKTTIKFGILILIMSLFALNLAHANNDKIFKDAGVLYKSGNYDNALIQYQKILNSGEHSAELYFNIANSYYKTNNFAQAIYYYEKAKLLAPNDNDINLNLRIANQKITDKIPVIEPFFLYRWMMRVVNMYHSSDWAVAFLIHLSLASAFFILQLFALRLWKRRTYFALGCTFMLLAIIGISASITRLNVENAKNTAIVISQAVNLKSGLDPAAGTAFILHEGTKVSILEIKDNWYKIRITDGREAWMPAKDLNVI